MFGSISGGMVNSGSGGRMVDLGSSGMEVVNSVSYGRVGVSSQKLHSCMAKFSLEWKFFGSMIDSQRR